MGLVSGGDNGVAGAVYRGTEEVLVADGDAAGYKGTKEGSLAGWGRLSGAVGPILDGTKKEELPAFCTKWGVVW